MAFGCLWCVRRPCIVSSANAPTACMSRRICLKYFSCFKVAVGSQKDPQPVQRHVKCQLTPCPQTSISATGQRAPGVPRWLRRHRQHAQLTVMAHRGDLAYGNRPLGHPLPDNSSIPPCWFTLISESQGWGFHNLPWLFIPKPSTKICFFISNSSPLMRFQRLSFFSVFTRNEKQLDTIFCIIICHKPGDHY